MARVVMRSKSASFTEHLILFAAVLNYLIVKDACSIQVYLHDFDSLLNYRRLRLALVSCIAHHTPQLCVFPLQLECLIPEVRVA